MLCHVKKQSGTGFKAPEKISRALSSNAKFCCTAKKNKKAERGCWKLKRVVAA